MPESAIPSNTTSFWQKQSPFILTNGISLFRQ